MVSKRYIEAAVKAAYIQGQRDGYKAAVKGTTRQYAGELGSAAKQIRAWGDQIRDGKRTPESAYMPALNLIKGLYASLQNLMRTGTLSQDQFSQRLINENLARARGYILKAAKRPGRPERAVQIYVRFYDAAECLDQAMSGLLRYTTQNEERRIDRRISQAREETYKY